MSTTTADKGITGMGHHEQAVVGRMMHAAIKQLAAADSDRACERNGVGFSRFDSGFGHALARLPSLTSEQAEAAAWLVLRYQGQLDSGVVVLARRLLADCPCRSRGEQRVIRQRVRWAVRRNQPVRDKA